MLCLHSLQSLGSLLISSPGPRDEGRFECIATNAAGEARKVFLVSVHGELLGLGALLRVAFPGSVTTSGVMWVCSSPTWGWVSSQGLGLGVDKRGREIVVPM